MLQLAMDSLQNPSLEDPHIEPPSPVHQGDTLNAGQWSAVLESESTLASFIMMLDIIAKQVRGAYFQLFLIHVDNAVLYQIHKLEPKAGYNTDANVVYVACET
jgi:hypothetical protein